jgi:hypothetical protein
MSVEEVKLVVSGLTADEFSLLSQWLDEFRARQWDRQIESDVLAGKLDPAGRRADDDFESGRCSIVNEARRH